MNQLIHSSPDNDFTLISQFLTSLKLIVNLPELGFGRKNLTPVSVVGSVPRPIGMGRFSDIYWLKRYSVDLKSSIYNKNAFKGP